MKIKAFLLLLIIYSPALLGQVVLIREGVVINNTDTGTWLGDNILRSVPTKLNYRNNSITSMNSQGYLLQAGDESPGSSNNNLDGKVVTGNKFVWSGINIRSIITHGLFLGYNINSLVKFNYLDNAPYGIIFKSGTDFGENMTFTSGGCAYNICKNGKFAVRMKGINIFYSTSNIPMISLESGCLTGFECDYNVYWCTVGEPTFNIDGKTKTWTQWRALGYDAHSIIADPNFTNNTDFIPTSRLNYGKDIGTEWQTGLSTAATWVAGTSPETQNQNGLWQVGARVYPDNIPVNDITLTGVNTITSNNGTLQLNASVLPASASNKTVSWSLADSTGQATISESGLVTAVNNGYVIVQATANDGSGVYGTLVIAISNQVIPVSSIYIAGTDNETTIIADNGTLQLNVSVLPANATDKSVTWSVSDGIGHATISATGKVTAVNDGIVTVQATATDGSGVFGTFVIAISNQITPVSSIYIAGTSGATNITTDNGTLQLTASILPAHAKNKIVTWSIIDSTGQATISESGLVTAVNNGYVTVQATATDGSGVFGTLVVVISNQLILSDGFNIREKNDQSLRIVLLGDEFKIVLNNNFLAYKAYLYNVQGTLITWKIVNKDFVAFETSRLPSGIYFVAISNGSNYRVLKAIKP